MTPSIYTSLPADVNQSANPSRGRCSTTNHETGWNREIAHDTQGHQHTQPYDYVTVRNFTISDTIILQGRPEEYQLVSDDAGTWILKTDCPVDEQAGVIDRLHECVGFIEGVGGLSLNAIYFRFVE